MEDVGILYVYLVYLTDIWYINFVAIWYNLWIFGIFSRFGVLYKEKSGNPDWHICTYFMAAWRRGRCFPLKNQE
jgi:hypothetical protein